MHQPNDKHRESKSHDSEQPLFDKTFDVVSYTANPEQDHSIEAMELKMHFPDDDATYYVQVVTTGNVRRSTEVSNITGEEDMTDHMVIIDAQEITPDHLAGIKATPYKILEPFLVKQDPLEQE